MKLVSAVVNSFGCSASGERLVSAARDGDFQEAQALLEYNPRLARYSTFGVRNSPLHYSAAHGHHEVLTLQMLANNVIEAGLTSFKIRESHWLLSLCLSFTCLQIVELLLQSGVDINLRNYRGQVLQFLHILYTFSFRDQRACDYTHTHTHKHFIFYYT